MRLLLVLLLLTTDSADLDRDGIADEEEQRLLEQFLPRFHIATGDCDGKPSEFLAAGGVPVSKDRNGVIYGRAFRSQTGIELHFYHLWAKDCGLKGHELDAEHVSAYLVADGAKWRARYWYAAAHEDTVCDRGRAVRADRIGAEHGGADFWLSAGKHASYFSPGACRFGCGADRCDRSELLVVPRVINLGEREQPLNDATWVKLGNWRLEEKFASDFSPALFAQLDKAKKVIDVNPQNPATQSIVLAGSKTVDGLGVANEKTEGALSKANKAVRGWIKKRLP